MLIRTQSLIPQSQVTDRDLYLNRRAFMVGAAALGMAGSAQAAPLADKPTPIEAVTSYNNFYEFSTDKELPAKLAPGKLRVKPWSVVVDGACAKPATVGLEDLLRAAPAEERIYRLRCVEGWSMVIPWNGLPLAPLLARFQPSSAAKYVEFTSLDDPEQMPGLKSKVLDWPYTEALRLDEAMHPLTFLATGLYGQDLPAQNGAPLRLVVPWKYGFKSIKSIVRIRFSESQPGTAWNKANPREYGFYSNVNPQVDHPRWSQATERRIGEFRRRDTLMFNGYADQVAGLYTGMDLAKYY